MVASIMRILLLIKLCLRAICTDLVMSKSSNRSSLIRSLRNLVNEEGSITLSSGDRPRKYLKAMLEKDSTSDNL